MPSKGKVLSSPAMSDTEDPPYCPPKSAAAGALVVNVPRTSKRKADPSAELLPEKKAREELSAENKELTKKYQALMSAVSLLISAAEDNLMCVITQEIPFQTCVDKESNQQTWNYPDIRTWVDDHRTNPVTRKTCWPSDLVRVPAVDPVLEKIADLSTLVPGEFPAWERLQRKSMFTSLSEQFGRDELSGENLELLSVLATEFDVPLVEKVKTYIRTMPQIEELLELVRDNGADDDDKLTLAEHWKIIDKLDKYYDIVWSLAPTNPKALRMIMTDHEVHYSEKSDLLIMYDGTETKYVCWAKMSHFARAADNCVDHRAKQRATDHAIERGSMMNTAVRDLTDDEICEANNLLRNLKGEPEITEVSDDDDAGPAANGSPPHSPLTPPGGQLLSFD